MLMNASLKFMWLKKGFFFSFWLKFSLAMKLNTQWQYSSLHVKLLHSDVQIRNVYIDTILAYFSFLLFEKLYFKTGHVINLMRRMRYSLPLSPVYAYNNLNKLFFVA